MATTFTSRNSQTNIMTNLDTFTNTIQTAGVHVVSVRCNVLPGSGVTVAIKQNASTIVTSAALTSPQSVISLNCNINAAVNDVISIVVASSNAIDQVPNAVKTSINIHVGSNN